MQIRQEKNILIFADPESYQWKLQTWITSKAVVQPRSSVQNNELNKAYQSRAMDMHTIRCPCVQMYM